MHVSFARVRVRVQCGEGTASNPEGMITERGNAEQTMEIMEHTYIYTQVLRIHTGTAVGAEKPTIWTSMGSLPSPSYSLLALMLLS